MIIFEASPPITQQVVRSFQTRPSRIVLKRQMASPQTETTKPPSKAEKKKKILGEGKNIINSLLQCDRFAHPRVSAATLMSLSKHSRLRGGFIRGGDGGSTAAAVAIATSGEAIILITFLTTRHRVRRHTNPAESTQTVSGLYYKRTRWCIGCAHQANHVVLFEVQALLVLLKQLLHLALRHTGGTGVAHRPGRPSRQPQKM